MTEVSSAHLYGNPQFPGVALVVLGLHLVEGEEPVESELVVVEREVLLNHLKKVLLVQFSSEVLLDHLPLLVGHLLPACSPVEQVELRPGERPAVVQVHAVVDVLENLPELFGKPDFRIPLDKRWFLSRT